MATVAPGLPGKLCWMTKIGGMPIQLRQQDIDRFVTVYWKEVKTELSYADACDQLGRALLHALSCEGKVDNRERKRR